MSETSHFSVDDQEIGQSNLSATAENYIAVQAAPNLGGGILNDVPNNSQLSLTTGTNHEGGVAPELAITAIPRAGATSSIPTATAGQGATSALLNAEHTSPGEAGSLTKSDQARLVFSFANPFVAAGSGNSMLPATNFTPLPSVSAASSDSQLEHDRRGVQRVAVKNISEMTAEELSNSLVSKISNFKTEVWIREDLSGQAIIENVEPSLLSDVLSSVAEISSLFIRTRTENILQNLVEKDMAIPEAIRAKWATARAAKLNSAQTSPVSQPNQQANANVPRVLFQPNTVLSQDSFVAPSTPAFFGAVNGRISPSPIHATPPSFMSEVPSRLAFPVHENSHFDIDPTQGRAFVSGGGAGATAGNFNITIHQAAVSPPAYSILESCSDPTSFYNWLKKNRKELLLARPCDRKRLNELCSRDVQEELGRIVVTSNRAFKELFDANHPYPTCWPDVSDALLLRILFGIHGPRSANDAKTRLELRPFFFNDSTTYQDQFCGKLRKFNSNFKTTLADFSYSSHKWPIDDQLTKEMIRDAYVKCLSSTETIKNPAGTMVPKCRNLAMCRELIRQKKTLPLEEIMDFLTDYFDHQDSVIRSTQGLSYLVTPWNVQGKKAQKRGFNQVSTPGPNQGASKAAKPPRPPALHPRCCNCGSRAHASTERTCYLWGHQKGLGASGVWPEGTPSLKLSSDEWSAWKKIRHATFYSYQENQTQKKST
jgi:hypothetical protein